MLNGLHRSINKTWHFISRRPISLRCFIQEKDAPAQGMVEFALVLPILLLVIFGIVAFGHFFFSYSLVVAASRDAARFGAAVGLTENSLPRYRDCKEIRNAAVGSGKFAGVDGTDATVSITYDQGPKLDGTTVVYEGPDPVTGVVGPIGCPIDGIGPGFIELGDRIVVTVTANYRPIVPLVAMEDMTLTATSRRTIMLGMPVGDQPMAEAPKCIGTLTRIVPPNWDYALKDPAGFEGGSFSRVGEPVLFEYETIADKIGSTAQGMIYLSKDDAWFTAPDCSHAAPEDTSCKLTFDDITNGTPHIMRAKYDPGIYATGDPCYVPTKAEPLRHYVISADTETKILPLTTSEYEVGDIVTINVEVTPKLPAEVGKPTGEVIVTGEGTGETCTITLVQHPTEEKSYGSCDLTFTEMNNSNTITAIYDKDPGTNSLYNSSFATVAVDVDKAATPEPTLSCPAFQGLPMASSSGPDITLAIYNGKTYEIELDRIQVQWNSKVSLVNVYFGTNTIGPALYPPPSIEVPINNNLALSGVTNMRLEFDSPLQDGTYTITGVLGTLGDGCPSFTTNVTVTGNPYP